MCIASLLHKKKQIDQYVQHFYGSLFFSVCGQGTVVIREPLLGLHFYLPSCAPWELDSGHQAWQQELLAAESSPLHHFDKFITKMEGLNG